MNNRMELALAGVVAENAKLRAERDQLQAIAAGACFRIVGLEVIISRFKASGGIKTPLGRKNAKNAIPLPKKRYSGKDC